MDFLTAAATAVELTLLGLVTVGPLVHAWSRASVTPRTAAAPVASPEPVEPAPTAESVHPQELPAIPPELEAAEAIAPDSAPVTHLTPVPEPTKRRPGRPRKPQPVAPQQPKRGRGKSRKSA